MSRKQTRLVSLLLCGLLLSVSCGSSDGETTEAVTDDTTSTETTEPASTLPDKDYGGIDVNMLVRTEFKYEFGAEESGDIVDDAVYARNVAIEDKFNIKLNIVDVSGSWATQSTFLTAISGDVMSGAGEYDLFASAANYMLPTVPEGYYMDLYEVPYVDLSQVWWSQGYVDNMTIDGSLYLASGSASINLLENMCVIFFNKDMITDYGLEDTYTLVSSGEWTIDKLIEQGQAVRADLNNDGKYNEDDRLGLFTCNNMMIAQTISFGLPFTERDSDGYPVISYMSERMTTAFDKVKGYIAEGLLYNYTTSTDTLDLNGSMQQIFQNGNVLYMAQLLSSAQVMRSMETDFGIIPMPKLDDTQDRYYTCVLENMTVLGIPTSVKDPELSGLVLEMLAEEGYKSVVPTYFEKALGAKYVRDEQSNEMLDLILDTVWFDFAYLNSVTIDSINHLFNSSLNGSLVSNFESRRPVFEEKLAGLIEGYKELKQ